MIPTKNKESFWTDEQWQAIHLDNSNIIVSAGAGSGKTAVLTERVMQKLNKGININDLIILTFTNAAALEMKERIRKKIIKEIPNKPELKKQLIYLNQASITTFDSFSLALIKKYHYLLNLPKNISIIDESLMKINKKNILDNIFNDMYSDESFKDFINTYTVKDDNRIKGSIDQINTKLNNLYNKKEYLNNYIANYYNEKFIDSNILEYVNNIKKNIKVILNLINKMNDVIIDPLLTTFINDLTTSLEPLIKTNSYEEIREIIALYNLPTLTRSKKVDELELSEVKKYYTKLTKYFNNLKDLTIYNSINEIKEEILSTKKYAEVIVNILTKYEEEIFKYKLKNNSFEFNDITSLAISLLENNNDIVLEIKNKTNEIMIDEYQDTNDINDYFISLISNHNVYMVGDVKQSIYKFRNANPHIFNQKYNAFKKEIDGIAINLNKNFRSRNEVIDIINLIFSKTMNENIGGVDYNEHYLSFGNNSYIEKGKSNDNYNLEVLDYDYKETNYRYKYSQDEIEIFIIANDIINKISNKYQVFDMETKVLRDVKYSDFVILLDRKTSFDLYKKIFEYKGIPLNVYKDETFVYANEIYALKNILKLINSVKENDNDLNYSFMSVARSYLFSYNDNDILEAISNKNIVDNEKFKDLFDKIKYLANYAKSNPLSNFLTEIYKIFNFYTKSIMIGNVTDVNIKLDYLLEISENLEKYGYNLKEFTLYFEELFDKDLDITYSTMKNNSTNAVNIMTIHRSKGLEYHICYYAGLSKDFNRDDLKENFLFDQKIGLILPVIKEGLTETIYKKLVKEEFLKEDIAERLRVLYVALTRAKEKIILVSNLSEIEDSYYLETSGSIDDLEKINYSSFEDILLSIKKNLKPYINHVNYEVTKEYESLKNVDYHQLLTKTDNKYKYLNININKEIVKKEEFSKVKHILQSNQKMALGTKIHEYLELINFKNYEQDIIKYEINDIIGEKIRNLFNMPFMANINNSKVYKEYAFYYKDDVILKEGQIDLLLESDNEFIIVDYKTKNIINESYEEQIKGYMKYIKGLSKKRVLGYLYSIIDGEYKEIRLDDNE